jgi:hypothetical protein
MKTEKNMKIKIELRDDTTRIVDLPKDVDLKTVELISANLKKGEHFCTGIKCEFPCKIEKVFPDFHRTKSLEIIHGIVFDDLQVGQKVWLNGTETTILEKRVFLRNNLTIRDVKLSCWQHWNTEVGSTYWNLISLTPPPKKKVKKTWYFASWEGMNCRITSIMRPERKDVEMISALPLPGYQVHSIEIESEE